MYTCIYIICITNPIRSRCPPLIPLFHVHNTNALSCPRALIDSFPWRYLSSTRSITWTRLATITRNKLNGQRSRTSCEVAWSRWICPESITTTLARSETASPTWLSTLVATWSWRRATSSTWCVPPPSPRKRRLSVTIRGASPTSRSARTCRRHVRRRRQQVDRGGAPDSVLTTCRRWGMDHLALRLYKQPNPTHFLYLIAQRSSVSSADAATRWGCVGRFYWWLFVQ